MRKVFSKLYTVLCFIFLYAPIVILIIFSFNQSKGATWTGFTTKWYGELFRNESIISSFVNTLIVALFASVISTVLGTLGAFGINNMKKYAKGTMRTLTYIQILNPEIVTGISLMILFAYFKMSSGFVTLILAHITFCVPTVVLSVLPKLRQMNVSLYEAAMDLGCNRTQAFIKVVIPEIMPGIISGFLMALTYSIDDFVISYFTSGTTSQTLPVVIYSMTKKQVTPTIYALSTLMFVAVLTVLIIYNALDIHFENERRKALGAAGRKRRRDRRVSL